MCMHDTEARRSAFPSVLSNSNGEFGAKTSGNHGPFCQIEQVLGMNLCH
jgi:hypothetical protein